MDKFSVLADAISYLKHLKKQVESLQDEVVKDDKAISFLGVQKRSLSTVNSGQFEDEEVDGSVIREFQRHDLWQWPLPQPQKPRARCSCWPPTPPKQPSLSKLTSLLIVNVYTNHSFSIKRNLQENLRAVVTACFLLFLGRLRCQSWKEHTLCKFHANWNQGHFCKSVELLVHWLLSSSTPTLWPSTDLTRLLAHLLHRYENYTIFDSS